MAEARSALRVLLRLVDKHLTKPNGNTLWRSHVLEQFRRHRATSSAEEASELLEYAKDQAQLIKAVQFQRVGDHYAMQASFIKIPCLDPCFKSI